MPQSLERANADSFDEKTQALKENGNLKLKSGKAESGNSKEENAVPQSHEGGSTDSKEKNLQPDFRKGGRDDESEKNQNNRGRQSEGYQRGQVFALSVK